ncbi:MAG: serine/threonine-protein kinase, partial [Pirellulaceae bacterium]
MSDRLDNAFGQRLAGQVVDAWSSNAAPPDLSTLLNQCDSARCQLDVLLADLRCRWEHQISVPIEEYFRQATLVRTDYQTRLELLDQELRYRKQFGDEDDVSQLLATYPELYTTAIHDASPADCLDTIVNAESNERVDQTDGHAHGKRSLDKRTNDSTLENFGRYEVIRLLGRGGFGSVYLARDSQLDRLVAIKSLHQVQFVDDTQSKEFLREASSTARLSHPSIVTLYDVAKHSNGSLFVVMEYVDGESLAQRLTGGKLPLSEGLEILIRVAQALGYAHRRGFVHRDLKPANILIDKDGRPRVADFGLAVHEEMQHLKAGEIAGTPAYMSPEQVRGRTHHLDGRTDIWSLGVILYQVLTGRLPFSGHTINDLFDEILNRDPRPPRQLEQSVNPALNDICLKCLSRNVEQRYSSAEDVAIALDKCLPDLAVGEELSIASNPAMIIAGLGLIFVGCCMTFVGGFFVWISILGMQWAFGGLSNAQEYLFGLATFSVLSSPFFLGLPTVILGLWVAVVQGMRWRGRTHYTSGKAVAALALASMTPLFSLFVAIPAVLCARSAFLEVRRKYPRVRGRALAALAVFLAVAGTGLSTWLIARASYVYTAYQAVDRCQVALNDN